MSIQGIPPPRTTTAPQQTQEAQPPPSPPAAAPPTPQPATQPAAAPPADPRRQADARRVAATSTGSLRQQLENRAQTNAATRSQADASPEAARRDAEAINALPREQRPQAVLERLRELQRTYVTGVPPQYSAELMRNLQDREGVLTDAARLANTPAGPRSQDTQQIRNQQADQRALDSAISGAQREGVLPPEEMRRIRAAGTQAAAPLTSQERAAVGQMEAARGRYETAESRARVYQDRLNAELSTLHALTPAQREEYTHRFWNRTPEAQRARAERDAALGELDRVTRENASTLEAAATRDPGTAQSLLRTHQALASHPSTAQTALDFARRVGSDAGTPVGRAFSGHREALQNVVTRAAPQRAAQLLANGTDPKLVYQHLSRELGPLMGARSVFSAGQSALELRGSLADPAVRSLMDRAANGDAAAVRDLRANLQRMGPFGQAMAGISVLSGAASAVENAGRGEYARAVGDLARAGEEGARALASGLFAAGSAANRATGNVLMRLAPAFGMIARGASAVEHIGRAWGPYGNGLDVMAGAAAAAGALGSAAKATVVGYPAGVIIEAGADLAEAAFKFGSDLINAREVRNARQRTLGEMFPNDPQLAQALANTHPLLQQRMLATGMTEQQVQAMLRENPALANGQDYPYLFRAMHRLGSTPEGMANLLRQARERGLALDRLEASLRMVDISTDGDDFRQKFQAYDRFQGAGVPRTEELRWFREFFGA
ncbi:MAG: hypothetical protein AB2A00_10235 [Myxococcota bacterium]